MEEIWDALSKDDVYFYLSRPRKNIEIQTLITNKNLLKYLFTKSKISAC